MAALVTLLDLFRLFAGRDEEYLIDGWRRFTYRQVAGAAWGVARRLERDGIGRGDRVVLWGESSPEWVAAFWGCVLRGAQVVPLDRASSAEFARHVAEACGARLTLTGDMGVDWAGAAPGEFPEAAPDDVAEIVFTSGATAAPKGVLLTHRNLLANLAGPAGIVDAYRKYFRPLLPVRFLSLIPLSHMFGQMIALFVVPLIPGTVVFPRGYQPEAILRQARRWRVTAAVAVPKLLTVLETYVRSRFAEVEEPDGRRWWWRWWHYRRVHAAFGWRFWAFLVGGAPLARESEDFWARMGIPVVQGYGLTETAPIVSFNNPFAIRRGTAGRVLAGTEVRIAEDGEVLVRGPSVSPGYLGRAGDVTGGWLHTGDLGVLDAGGHLTIRGRKKDLIVTADGRKVFPDDVELVLEKIDGVREAAVVGRDRVHAVLVVAPGADVEAIVRAANGRLEEHQRVRGYSLWPGARLPRTEATQKLKRAAIQAWLDGGAAPAEARARGDTVLEIVRARAPGRAVTEGTTLEELGLSSLERVELAMELEERLGRPVDEAAGTVGELERGVEFEFPEWGRGWAARALRRVVTEGVLLPLARLVAWRRVAGLEHVRGLAGPVVFAPNHQSHLDTPVLLGALPGPRRRRVAVAMWKEYFDAWFHPEGRGWAERARAGVEYFLAAALFHGVPLPQTEARAGASLRYLGELMGEGWSIVYFPEGERTETGQIGAFRAGIGFLAARLGAAVVPVRLEGVDRVLHRGWHVPRPGRVSVRFGAPLRIGEGETMDAFAERLRAAVIGL